MVYCQNVNDPTGSPPTKSTAATHVQSLSPQPMRTQTDFSIRDLRNDARNTVAKNAPVRSSSSPDADEGAGSKKSNTFSFRGRGGDEEKMFANLGSQYRLWERYWILRNSLTKQPWAILSAVPQQRAQPLPMYNPEVPSQ